MDIKMLAKVLSYVFSPFVSAAAAVVVIVYNFYTISEGVHLLLTGILFLSVLPFAFVFLYAVKRKADIDIPERSSRPIVFLPGFVSYVCSTIIFYLINQRELFALSTSYITVSLTVLIITLRWKISIHSAGLAGPITALVYIFGWEPALSYILVLLLIWARIKLEVHSFAQAATGAAVSILVTFITFLTFY